MSLISDIFGGGGKPQQLPAPPAWKPDPTYTAQQNFLQPYSMGLLSGNNIPDYYKSIGEQNSPEFQQALGVSNAAIGTAAAEGAARAGTGRGGQLPQVTAQQVGNNTATLTYQDFLNSNAGKQFLMGEGQQASNSVLTGALTNQGQENSYDLGAYTAGNNAIIENNAINSQQSAQLGSLIGTLLPAATTVAGGIIGGPAGATVGQTVGSALGGNTSSIASLFNPASNGIFSAGTAPSNTAPDTSNLGAIDSMSSADMMKYFGIS